MIRWKKTISFAGFVLLCGAIIFATGHMLDSGGKWIAVPLVIILLILGITG